MNGTPRTIVLGAAGQVGSALMAQLGDAGVGIIKRCDFGLGEGAVVDGDIVELPNIIF